MVCMGLMLCQSHKFSHFPGKTFLIFTADRAGGHSYSSLQLYCKKCSTIYKTTFVHLIVAETS